MKICSKCKKVKSLSQFNYKKKNQGIKQSRCRICTRREIKQHYLNNRAYYLQKAKERNDMMRKITKQYVLSYLNKHPCVDCGEKDPVVLEFDHIFKRDEYIAILVKNGAYKKVKEEILKCEVRCANCHRRITAKRHGWQKFHNLPALVA